MRPSVLTSIPRGAKSAAWYCPRPGYSGRQRSIVAARLRRATTDDANENNDNGHNEQDVNQPANRVRRHQAEQPQNNEDDGDCVKHRRSYYWLVLLLISLCSLCGHLLASWPTMPPIAAPPRVPAVLPPVRTAPPTAPAPAPIAVLRPCRDIPPHAVRLATSTRVRAPAAILLPVFIHRS